MIYVCVLGFAFISDVGLLCIMFSYACVLFGMLAGSCGWLVFVGWLVSCGLVCYGVLFGVG